MEPTEILLPSALTAPKQVSPIREVLRRIGYSESRILHLLHTTANLPSFRQRVEGLALYLWHTRSGTALDVFTRLFFLHQQIPVDDARRVLAPTSLDDWTNSGLLDISGDEATASVELCPYENLLLAADWSEDQSESLCQVMGVAASSRTLAQATVRRHCRAALDLGTGCGVLALLAAKHSGRVVAVDSNPRALHRAEFNAQLNGFNNITYAEGDLFEPVRGDQFDLIVCNPPFVIAPEQIHLHTQSGMPLDRLCETIVRSAPNLLSENGYCQLLCNWVQPAGVNWRERLASWFIGSGCDAWVLYSHSESAGDYISNRIAEMAMNPDEREQRFNTWIGYFEQEKIEAVGFGLINLRRSTKPSNWFKCDSWPEMVGSSGDAIERGFAARDFLDAHTDEDLLAMRLRHAPNLQWRQDHKFERDVATIQSSLRLTTGLTFTRNVDVEVGRFVSQCQGEQPLKVALHDVAERARVEENQLAPRFLKVIRNLLEFGFLETVETRPN